MADQLFAGLYGAIVVEGDDEPLVDQDRVLVISDVTLGASGRPAAMHPMDFMMGREGELLLVNGEHEPQLEAVAGTVERWRIINACPSRYLRLQLDDHDVAVIGHDGIPVASSITGEVLLLPGGRVDLLMVPRAGETIWRTLDVDRGDMGMLGLSRVSAEMILARIDASPGEDAAALPVWRPSAVRDLRDAVVATTRTLTFTMDQGRRMGHLSFGFDGLAFDPERIDQTVELGHVEEWIIGNSSPMDHPFHLHVWPMQVVSGPEADGEQPVWRDVVNVPPASEVRVRIAFENFSGRTVYHCHVLDHEDLGMMGIVEVR